MTEDQWERSNHPYLMLENVRKSGRLTDRKQRLYSVAGCRRIGEYLDEPCRKAVLLVERFADGLATDHERALAEADVCESSRRLCNGPWDDKDRRSRIKAFAASAVVNLVASREEAVKWFRSGQYIAEQVSCYLMHVEHEIQGTKDLTRHQNEGESWPMMSDLCGLVREIFDDPSRQGSAVDCSWISAEVLGLAQTIYDQRSFERLGELADAIEEAGCPDSNLISHLRSPGPHVRGCWALDRLLGRE